MRDEIKNFDIWSTEKKRLHQFGSRPLFHTRQIRWCSFGINIGFEQNGTNSMYRRPALILRAFTQNLCLVIPLTTSKKSNPYHLYINQINGKDAFVIISQIRFIDTKRLHGLLGTVEKIKFKEIRKAVRKLI